MPRKIGPDALDHFEDRVLYHLVALAGDRPLPVGAGVSEMDLAPSLADDLGLAPEELATSIARGAFYHTDVRGMLLAAVDELMREGYIDGEMSIGPCHIRPTSSGRRRVAKWREDWERQKRELDQRIEQRILADLERHYRADPGAHESAGHVNVAALCADLDITHDDYRATAGRLLDQGKIAPRRGEDRPLDEGYICLTEAGIAAVEARAAAMRPRRDAQEAWVEVARLRRQLELAQRTRPSLIGDEELRRRCEDLLAAGGHYDRVIREACVILENRVRVTIGADKGLTGVPLMEKAFSPKGGPLQLSGLEQEQLGAMQLYRSLMAFFRNAAGHHIIDTYSVDDALRFVGWVDLLLGMVETARMATASVTATTGGPAPGAASAP